MLHEQLAQAMRLALFVARALGAVRQIVGDRVGRLFDRGESVRVRAHEGEYALDAGGLPNVA